MAGNETENELDMSWNMLIKNVQREHYNKEIAELQWNKVVSNRSPIAPFPPFKVRMALQRNKGLR